MGKRKKMSRKKRAKMQKKANEGRMFAPAPDIGMPPGSRHISEMAYPEIKDMTDEEYLAWRIWHWETIGQYEMW